MPLTLYLFDLRHGKTQKVLRMGVVLCTNGVFGADRVETLSDLEEVAHN